MDLFHQLITRPNDYFPFTVDPVACGGSCEPPISEGNVLLLYGDNLTAGSVQVTYVGDQTFQFVGLEDHFAPGGTVQFYIKSIDESRIELEIEAFGAGRGIEGQSPKWFSAMAGNVLWPSMAAAFVCQRVYAGNEQYRRC